MLERQTIARESCTEVVPVLVPQQKGCHQTDSTDAGLMVEAQPMIQVWKTLTQETAWRIQSERGCRSLWRR
jgi:hypothetical protein